MAVVLKIFSISQIVVGILAIFLQICELIIFRNNNGLNIPDLVSSGVWGGFFLVLFGVLLMTNKLKEKEAIQGLAAYGYLIGITIIGLYSWSISRYQYAIPECSHISITNVTLCSRVALDSLLIMCGILAFLLNVVATVLASTLTED